MNFKREYELPIFTTFKFKQRQSNLACKVEIYMHPLVGSDKKIKADIKNLPSLKNLMMTENIFYVQIFATS